MSTATRSPPARMRALRTLSLVLAFTAAVGLIFGTAGFTAMEADRGLAVNVTNDTSAYLGYEPLTDEVHDGESTPVVEYRNQFGSDLDEFDVNVSIADTGATAATIESVETPSSLDRGAALPVNVTLHCSEEEPVPLLFEADGSGGGVSVSLDRTHTVTCVPKGPTVTGVEFNDGANGNVTVQSANGFVDATVWIAENPADGVDELGKVTTFDGDDRLDTAEKIRSQVDDPPENWKIAAVEFPGQGVTYVHPGWDAGDYENPSSGDGVEYEGAVDEEFLLNASVDGNEVVAESGDGD
ncbi:hypothetical protein [Halorubrum sp. CBA1229]|uniref:hypothetical protein n=1 Tax=Halorubrum sp. CBA1229 TaxID=1853699 RepID=UPI000F4171E0|nr:hypothetical protein [Halorubrum sp. CBA1229]QKY17072.1 hypothetical protein Hrr1229_009325 [Halorubrum sp. CBA1229]